MLYSMSELEKKITGDWFDIRENSENETKLEDLFRLNEQKLREIIEEIRNSVEEGILEYKRKMLFPVFPFLESLKYDSRGLEHLLPQAAKLTSLLYVLLLQRLLARGTIALSREAINLETEGENDLKTIIQDINARIKENPEIASHPAVKNIFMQMNIYKKELENMKKMSPNIPQEKSAAFFTNFKKTFAAITSSIIDNYSQVLKEEAEKLQESMHLNPLAAFDLTPVAKLCFTQANEVS
ncbi:MAG: hypothetical protein AB1798_01360, partial [Spirochaetota bacterium]